MLRPRRFALPRAMAAAVALAGGCTSAQLYDPQGVPSQADKVSFRGRVCTDNPAERSFPLRVVFVVDVSPDLPVTDDNAAATLALRRHDAVLDAMSVLPEDAAFTIVRYGGSAQIAPPTFSDDNAAVAAAAGGLAAPLPNTGDGGRRLPAALSLAASAISGDLLTTPRGPRSRTKYVVVIVQAGPTDDLVVPAGTDLPTLLRDRAADLRRLVLDGGAADFQLHVLDASPISSDPAVFLPARAELEPVAFAGGGEYEPVCVRANDGSVVSGACSPENVSLRSLAIQSARNVFLQKSFIVSNRNALSTNEGTVPDSDADGIADADEDTYGTNPSARDTDGDGIRDQTELLLSTVGLDPLAADDPPACQVIDAVERPVLDSDGDGMTDCEEILLRLDPTLFDTDKDGSPDILEVDAGTNFLEDDGLADADFDGAPNNVELKAHTDPRAADAKARNELSYLYREVDLGIREILFSSQPRNITGARIVDVSAGSTLGNGTLRFTLDGGAKLAWRDAAEREFGPAERASEDGTVTLRAACEGKDPCDREVQVEVSAAILPPFPVDELLLVASAERQCTDFRVRNITLTETLAADGRPAGHNDIRIYFGQVPRDVPGAFGIFRVAELPFTFEAPDVKDPNVAELEVEDFRFVLFE